MDSPSTSALTGCTLTFFNKQVCFLQQNNLTAHRLVCWFVQLNENVSDCLVYAAVKTRK